MKVAEGLADRGLMSSLDYLGENTKTRAEAEHAIKMYDEIVTAIHNSRHHDKINISIKLTQCGLDIDEDWAEQNYRNLLQHAQQKNTFVRVDMEASEYTERLEERALQRMVVWHLDEPLALDLQPTRGVVRALLVSVAFGFVHRRVSLDGRHLRVADARSLVELGANVVGGHGVVQRGGADDGPLDADVEQEPLDFGLQRPHARRAQRIGGGGGELRLRLTAGGGGG